MIDIIINIVLFFTGLFLGNGLAIGRDKRKEFNEIADKVHLDLKREADKLLNSNVITTGLTDVEIEKLRRRISFFKRKGFDLAIAKYKEVKSSSDKKKSPSGQVLYVETEDVIEAIRALQKYTSRR